MKLTPALYMCRTRHNRKLLNRCQRCGHGLDALSKTKGYATCSNCLGYMKEWKEVGPNGTSNVTYFYDRNVKGIINFMEVVQYCRGNKVSLTELANALNLSTKTLNNAFRTTKKVSAKTEMRLRTHKKLVEEYRLIYGKEMERH